MKRKKWLALVMAAALTITGTGQTAGVLAAEFTDAEEYVSPQADETVSEQGADVGNTGETAQWENDAIFSSDAEELDAEPEEFAEPELPEEEFEEELFSSEEPEEVFGDGDTEEVVSAGTATADYRGMMISEAELEHLVETGEAPDREWVEKNNASFAELMNSFSNKTGYLLVAAGNNEGYENLVIPEGLTVVIACGSGINIQSITPNGNILIWENVFTQGTLEIKAGAGSVTFKDSPISGGNVKVTGSVTFRNCQVFGTIIGNGSNDTVTFAGDLSYILGIQGVENVIFSEQAFNLQIGEAGKTEFYNIKNETDADIENRNIYLDIAGYSKDSLPVFHKNFDLGTCRVVNDDGTVDEWGAGIGINYIETFDIAEGEEPKWIDIGAGNPAVKFADLSDVDILSMCGRMWDGSVEPGYSIDMDGTAISNKEDRQVLTAYRFQSSDGVSAEEAFYSAGRDDVPDGCTGGWFESNTLKTMMRALEADQKSGSGQGYYCVTLPHNYKATETLTVPDSVTGVLYAAETDYNEETDAYTIYPVQISSINIPSGKAVHLLDATGGTGTLKITGAGTAAFISCRMNQDITAGDITLVDTSVKSLTCDNLTCEYDVLAVGEALEFKKAVLPGAGIFAKAGAVLNFGEIDNEGLDDGYIDLILETNNGKTAAVNFTDDIKLGVIEDEDGKHETSIGVVYVDYAAAAAAGAPCAKSIYNSSGFSLWNENEEMNVYNFLAEYDGKALKLMSFTGKAAAWLEENHTLFASFENIDLTAKNDNPLLPDGKHFMANMENGEEVKAYIQTDITSGAVSISTATVSDISSQTYTGTALKPSVTVKMGTRTLVSGTDYTVSYTNNINAGTATVTITGKGNYSGTLKKTFKITARKLSASDVTLKYPYRSYTGKALKNVVTVKNNGKTLVKGTDYKVSYKNNTKIGTATVTIKGKGNYKGTITKTYEIVPKKGSIYTVGKLKYKITRTGIAKGTVTAIAPVKTTYTAIKVPASVKIEGYTFKVTGIGAKAFKGNTKLKTVTIGKNVKTIVKKAFYGCKALTSIKINSKVLTKVGANSLKGINAKAVITVPAAKLTAYTALLKGKGQGKNVKITK